MERPGQLLTPKEVPMGAGSRDKAKGYVEEAVGAATNDADMMRRGRVDQGAGKVKDTAERVVDKVADALTDEPRRR
jgi:uncharacterized protein YjbJ (UPF0337 family)